jgi:uncharacterized membrane protein YheB (UPF0754 family)
MNDKFLLKFYSLILKITLSTNTSKQMITYINEKEVDFLMRDYELKAYSQTKNKFSISGGLKNYLKVSYEYENVIKEHYFDKLLTVNDFLSSNNLISYIRPKTTFNAEETSNYIFEEIQANKILFPQVRLKDFPYINEIVTWIAKTRMQMIYRGEWSCLPELSFV